MIEVTEVTDKPLSLRDRMLAAETVEALEALRKEGSRYNNARSQTRAKWRKAFNWRKAQLEAAMTEEQLKAEEARRAARKAAVEAQSA